MNYKLTLLTMLILALLIGACAPGGGVGNNPPEVAQLPTATPFPTAPAAARTTYIVQRGTVSDNLEFRGRWLPRDQMQLSFEVAGTVRAVNVQRDDTVTAGTLLADLQITDLENQLASQELSLQTAQRRLDSGGDTDENSVDSAAFQLANSKLTLQSNVAGLPWTSVEDAKVAVTDAERSIENAERTYNDLVSRPDSSPTQVDSAYEALKDARDGLEQRKRAYHDAVVRYYQSTIQITQQENNILQNELNLERAIEGGGNPDLVEAVQSAQLSVDQTRQKILQSSLYAPIDGVVLEITIKPGDAVQAFTAVITIAIPEPKEASASLAFNDIQRLAVGQVGTCNVVNQAETKVACIIRKLPTSNRDADQTVRVAASLENIQNGQLIEIEMPLEVAENALWLPPEAVNEFQNRTFVVLLTPEGERVRDVEIGLQTDDRVEIKSGLEERDEVVQQ